MTRLVWHVQVTYVIAAKSADHALELARAIVRDSPQPVAGIYLNESAEWTPEDS